ncbi:MAG: YbaK/EbsC family protein [Oscillospiraceae bacterium]
MSMERARAFLRFHGLEDRIAEFTVSSATVEEAALAVGCTPGHIAKTLSFRLAEGPILLVAAGDAKLNNTKFKAQFHQKATMLPRDEVERTIGHDVGGVCPFGIEPHVAVYLDLSLKRFDLVYPACGTASSAVRLTPAELSALLPGADWIDVCKDPDETPTPA